MNTTSQPFRSRIYTIAAMVAAFIFSLLFVNAQNPDYSKGGGTGNTTFHLASTSARKTQLIYLPGDFTPVVRGGKIYALYFRYGTNTSGNPQTLTDFIISLGQTGAVAFNNGNEFFTGLTEVFNRNSFTIPAGTAGDWFKIDLPVGFTYDPQLTLIVETQWATVSNTGFNTRTTTLSGRKVYTGTVTNATGTATTTWNDFGFALTPPTGNDAGITDITNPTTFTNPGVQNIVVNIRNFSNITLNSVTLTGEIDSLGTIVKTLGPVVYPGPIDTFKYATGVVVGNYNFRESPYTIRVRTSQPNGGTDTDLSNDEFTKDILSCAALNGSYTINQAVATGGTNFQSFADAITRMVQCGVSGAVTLNVVANSGPYIEQITIPGNIPGVSAVNTITFNGNNDTLKFAPTTTDRYIIKLDGADYITFTNLVIKSTATDFGWGVHLINEANFNTITNCLIDLSGVTSTLQSNTAGIVATNSTTSVITDGNNANNLTITNNTIIGGYTGIRIYGQSANLSKRNLVLNNVIKDFYTYATYMRYNDSLVFAGNDVSRPTRNDVTAFYGHFLTQSKKCITERNKIHNPYGGNLASTAITYGLYIGTSDAPVGEENVYFNNLLYNFNGAGTNYGIYNSGASGAWYYHNTISIDDQSNPSSNNSFGFYQTTVESNIKFLNNIVSVTKAGTGNKYAIYFNTPTSTIESNYNGLYVLPNDASSYVGFHNSISYSTLQDWQGANSNAYDQNSQFANPVFADINNADFTPGAGLIDNIGTPLGVTTDFNAQPRSITTPDPGAIEFSFAGLDAAIFYVGPVPPQNAGSYPVEVTIQNVGTATVTGVELGYTDGTVTETEVFTGLNIGAGSSQNIIFTAPYLLNSYVGFTVFIKSVNNQQDLSQLNDTARQTICVRLAGTYTINKTQPTSSINFTSFGDAVSAMVLCEVGGAVTFNVVSGTGPYSEQITIPAINGTSAVNTVTFNGNGNEISFNNTVTANRHIFRLNGAKHFVFDDLVLKSLNNTHGWGFHLYNGADSNTIRNCTIDLSSIITSTTTEDNSVGIVASNSTTSTTTTSAYNAKGLVISNNTITGGFQAIRLNGNSTTKAFFNLVENNTLLEFNKYGIYLAYQDSTILRGNDISRPTRTDISTTSYMIYVVFNCDNTLVEKNVIHDINNGNTAATDRTTHGIHITNLPVVGKTTKIFNNVLYNFFGNSSMYGLYHGGGAEAIYYHNTVSIDDNAAVNTTQITGGIYNSTVQTGIEFKNNIVSLNKSGNGPKYGMQVTQTGSTQVSNNNVIYVNTAQPNSYTGRFGSTNFITFADWQTANGGAYDQNSRGNNPMFVDAPNGDVTPTNPYVNNIGTPVGITTDINGNPRSGTNPDAGAIEFNASGLDASITSLISPQLPLSFGVTPVTVRVKSNLTIDVDSVMLTFTDGTVTESQMFYDLFLAENEDTVLTFTANYNFTSPTTFSVFISKVNTSLTDFDQTNDTISVDLCPAYSGNFTIDSTQAISATNYHSFQALANDLVNCGISTPVVVTVASDTFVEQVILKYVPGSSLTNTITFQSASGDSTLSVLSWPASTLGTDPNYTLYFDGASCFTFKNMSIERSGTNQTYSRVIEFAGGGGNNIFMNNILAGPTGSTSTATTQNRTTVFSLPSKCEHNRFENNWFRGNSNGFWYEGVVNNRSLGTTVINNRFENYWTSIYLINQVAPVVIGNEVTRSNPAATNTFYPISLQRVDSTLTVLKNKVNTLNAGQYGIRIREANLNAATPGLVANNFAQTGGTGTTANGAISIEDGNSNLNIYNNSVHMSGTSTNGRALNVAGTTSNVNFVNNIFVNSGGGHAYYVVTASTGGINVSDYNNIYSTGASVGFWGTAQVTLADLQAASGKDANSVSGDPLFVSQTDLHVSSAIVNNNAMPLAAVTDDIDGDLRDVLNPDMGADEFTPPFVDLTTTTVVSPGTFTCEEVSVPVTVVIYNQGNVAAADITVKVFVSGALTDTLEVFYPGPVNSLERDTITVDVISTVGGGVFTFTAFTESQDDTDPSNDTLRTSITVNAIPQPASFAVDYDSVCFATPASFVISNPVQNVFYYWFDAETGGNMLTTGNSYTTPALTANDTFYVETSSQFIGRLGAANNSIGAGGFTTAGYGTSGMNLNVTRGIYIDSVTVYTNGAGTVTFELSTSNNLTVLGVRSVAVSGAGMHRIPIGIYVAPGTYRVDANGSAVTGGLYRNTAGTAYPYSISGIASITTAVGTSTSYFWFYNWRVRVPGCDAPGARLPVYAYVDSNLTVGNATFSYTKNELAVDFNIATTSNQSTVTWDFGNGATDTGNSVSYTFPADGNYNVCATMTNPCNTDTKCQTVTVCRDLDSDFSFTYNPADSIAAFTLGGTGTPTLTVWDFGDGSNSIQSNPTHKYLTGNNFTVKLYTQNLCGQRDTVTKTLSNCAPLDIDFTAVEGANGLDFSVTTILTSGVPATISYDMGDGTTLSNISFTHTYATYGNYTITLTVTDACGNSDVATHTVSACQDVVAGFTSSVNGVSGTDISVAFTNQSTGNGLSYDWQFSDGSSSTDQHPVLVFTEGMYSATLTATNLCGETDVFVADVKACDMLEVNFNYTAVSNGLTVEFTNTTISGTPVTLSWDFGDGNTGSGNNPSHTYAAEGFYDVTLTAVNACGDSSTITENINVITIGIGSPDIDNSISVYPNPNNGLFNVARKLDADATTTITIYNILGEQVFFNNYELLKGNNLVEIDITHFAAGVYQVQVNDKLGNKVIRLFKE